MEILWSTRNDLVRRAANLRQYAVDENNTYEKRKRAMNLAFEMILRLEKLKGCFSERDSLRLKGRCGKGLIIK